MKETKFNQKKYKQEYAKAHYTEFRVSLLKEENTELENTLKKYNLSKAQFLRKAIRNFKEEKKMKKYYVTSGTQLFEKKGENGTWLSGGDTIWGNDNDKIFKNIEDATLFYDSLKLKDDIKKNTRYSDYKELYEIDGNIEDIDDIDLDEAVLIKDEYTFTA